LLKTKHEKSEATKRLTLRQYALPAYLGPQDAIGELDQSLKLIYRVCEHLKSGRVLWDVNTIVRKTLERTFEKARKLGKIKYNPIAATDALKHEPVAKDTSHRTV